MAEAPDEFFDFESEMRNLRLVDDPYPTKEFREIISYLKDVQTIIEELQKSEIICIPELLGKLSLTPGTKLETIYAPSTVIQRELPQRDEMSAKLIPLIATLLKYIVMKLSKCPERDAASILNDFNDLKSFIFVFRSSDCCDSVKLDKIIEMFSDKLIRMLKGSIDPDNFLTKFDIYAIMRVMIGEVGKNPVYAPVVIKQLIPEVKVYYEKINSLGVDDDLDVYIYECYLNYFYTIDVVLKSNLVDVIHKSDASLLPGLYTDLKALTQKKLKKVEQYLFYNIISLIQAHLPFVESMTDN